MSTSGIVHNDTFRFDGTHFHLWRIRMLCHFRAMGPNFVRIIIVGVSPWKDDLFPTLKAHNDMLLGYDAKNVIMRSITHEVFESIRTYGSAHEMWTKLEEVYGGSNLVDINCLTYESNK